MESVLVSKSIIRQSDKENREEGRNAHFVPESWGPLGWKT